MSSDASYQQHHGGFKQPGEELISAHIQAQKTLARYELFLNWMLYYIVWFLFCICVLFSFFFDAMDPLWVWNTVWIELMLYIWIAYYKQTFLDRISNNSLPTLLCPSNSPPLHSTPLHSQWASELFLSSVPGQRGGEDRRPKGGSAPGYLQPPNDRTHPLGRQSWFKDSAITQLNKRLLPCIVHARTCAHTHTHNYINYYSHIF